MANYAIGDKVTIRKPAHIFEGIIIMPGQAAEIQKINADGSLDLHFFDREMMPHTMPNMNEQDIQKA